jgi:hypothetical protein
VDGSGTGPWVLVLMMLNFWLLLPVLSNRSSGKRKNVNEILIVVVLRRKQDEEVIYEQKA